MSKEDTTPTWWIYQGKGKPHNKIKKLPEPQQFPLTEKLFYNHSFEKTTTVQIKKGILTDYA